MLAFTSSQAGLVLKSSSALSALRHLLHLLLVSGSFLLCVHQENLVPVFLQTANESHGLSWRMRSVGWLALAWPCRYPCYMDSSS